MTIFNIGHISNFKSATVALLKPLRSLRSLRQNEFMTFLECVGGFAAWVLGVLLLFILAQLIRIRELLAALLKKKR